MPTNPARVIEISAMVRNGSMSISSGIAVRDDA
jgi:hypothetical protein